MISETWRQIGMKRMDRKSSEKHPFQENFIEQLWTAAQAGLKSGKWPPTESYDEEDEDTNAVVDASTKIESIPRELVEDRGDGWYKWRGYWKWAPSMEEGHLLLNAAWHETQNMVAFARKQDARRQKQLQKLEATDDKFSRLRPVVLKRGTPDALTGRYTEDNNKVTFVEDGTNHRVTLSMPSNTQRRRGG